MGYFSALQCPCPVAIFNSQIQIQHNLWVGHHSGDHGLYDWGRYLSSRQCLRQKVDTMQTFIWSFHAGQHLNWTWTAQTLDAADFLHLLRYTWRHDDEDELEATAVAKRAVLCLQKSTVNCTAPKHSQFCGALTLLNLQQCDGLISRTAQCTQGP